ncbi:MAG: hypothetical protein MHPSP_000041 [Paramarteilia canceri]
MNEVANIFLDIQSIYNQVSSTNKTAENTSCYAILMIKHYISKIADESRAISDRVIFLENGLQKIDEMQLEGDKCKKNLETHKIRLIELKRQYNLDLAELTQRKKIIADKKADLQEKNIILADEQVELKKLAFQADNDLKKAMPVLEEATKALESINKRDISEIKSYGRPSPIVERVMEAVMLMRGLEPSWAEAKKQLGDANFISQLLKFDSSSISDKTLKKIGEYVKSDEFKPEVVGKVSEAAKSLCQWVIAIENYSQVSRIVEPKKQRLNSALSKIEKKQKALENSKNELRELETILVKMESDFQQQKDLVYEAKNKVEQSENDSDQLQKINNELKNEKIQWEHELEILNQKRQELSGNLVIESFKNSFLSNRNPSEWFEYLEKLKNSLKISRIPFTHQESENSNISEGIEVSLATENDSMLEKVQLYTKKSNLLIFYDDLEFLPTYLKSIHNSKESIYLLSNDRKFETKLFSLMEKDQFIIIKIIDFFDISIFLESIFAHKSGTLAEYTNIDIKKIFFVYDSSTLNTENINFYNLTIVDLSLSLEEIDNYLIDCLIHVDRKQLHEAKMRLKSEIENFESYLQTYDYKIIEYCSGPEISPNSNAELSKTIGLKREVFKQINDRRKMVKVTETKLGDYRNECKNNIRQLSILCDSVQTINRESNEIALNLDSLKNLFSDILKNNSYIIKLSEKINTITSSFYQEIFDTMLKNLNFEKYMVFTFLVAHNLQSNEVKVNRSEIKLLILGTKSHFTSDFTNNEQKPQYVSDKIWKSVNILSTIFPFQGLAGSLKQDSWRDWFNDFENDNDIHLPGEWNQALNDTCIQFIAETHRNMSNFEISGMWRTICDILNSSCSNICPLNTSLIFTYLKRIVFNLNLSINLRMPQNVTNTAINSFIDELKDLDGFNICFGGPISICSDKNIESSRRLFSTLKKSLEFTDSKKIRINHTNQEMSMIISLNEKLDSNVRALSQTSIKFDSKSELKNQIASFINIEKQAIHKQLQKIKNNLYSQIKRIPESFIGDLMSKSKPNKLSKIDKNLLKIEKRIKNLKVLSKQQEFNAVDISFLVNKEILLQIITRKSETMVFLPISSESETGSILLNEDVAENNNFQGNERIIIRVQDIFIFGATYVENEGSVKDFGHQYKSKYSRIENMSLQLFDDEFTKLNNKYLCPCYREIVSEATKNLLFYIALDIKEDHLTMAETLGLHFLIK